jgi:hypothetical protein
MRVGVVEQVPQTLHGLRTVRMAHAVMRCRPSVRAYDIHRRPRALSYTQIDRPGSCRTSARSSRSRT